MRARTWLLVVALTLLPACEGAPLEKDSSSGSPGERAFVLGGEPMRVCGLFGRNRCGVLDVPEDRADPAGRRIGLNVMVIPAKDPDPEPDAVFFLAGGPGGASVESWAGAANLFPGVHANRDIVLVDQRGTGRSNPLVFPEPPNFSGLSPHDARAAIRRWGKKVLASFDADPRLYASAQAADDLDDVRAALGYDRIDLYGASYGATLAQYYLRQHGEHARAVVLDGGTLVDVSIFERISENSQQALDSVLRRCADNAACSEAFPDPAGELARTLVRLARHPAETDLYDPWTEEPIVVDADALAGTIHQLLVTSAGNEVPLLIHQAATGRDDLVAERIRGSLEDPATSVQRLVMFWSIVCSEGWARFDPAEVARAGAGSYYRQVELEQARGWRLACSLMPQASVLPGDVAAVRSMVPVLLLNGSEDPQDPPSNVADAPRELPNSLVLSVPALGHTVGTFGCLPDVVAAFIEAGSVEGLDVSCVSAMSPGPFTMP